MKIVIGRYLCLSSKSSLGHGKENKECYRVQGRDKIYTVLDGFNDSTSLQGSPVKAKPLLCSRSRQKFGIQLQGIHFGIHQNS